MCVFVCVRSSRWRTYRSCVYHLAAVTERWRRQSCHLLLYPGQSCCSYRSLCLCMCAVMWVCVCVWERVCVCECMGVSVCMCAWVWVYVCMCAWMSIHPEPQITPMLTIQPQPLITPTLTIHPQLQLYTHNSNVNYAPTTPNVNYTPTTPTLTIHPQCQFTPMCAHAHTLID